MRQTIVARGTYREEEIEVLVILGPGSEPPRIALRRPGGSWAAPLEVIEEDYEDDPEDLGE